MMTIAPRYWILIACLAVISGWFAQPEYAFNSGLYFIMIFAAGVIIGFFAPLRSTPSPPDFIPTRRWILMGLILFLFQLPALTTASMTMRHADEGMLYVLVALPIFCQLASFLGMSLRTILEIPFRKKKKKGPTRGLRLQFFRCGKIAPQP